MRSLVVFPNHYHSIHKIWFHEQQIQSLKRKQSSLGYKHTDKKKEGSPGWYTGTYPQQTVSNVSDHIVYLLGGEQPQREGAPLILYQQLEEQKSHLNSPFSLIYPDNLFKTDVTDTCGSTFWQRLM